MRSYNRIIAAAASIVTVLVLAGCGESYVSDDSDTSNATMSAGRLEAWPNNYSYSRPEASIEVNAPQPAGAQLPSNAGSSQLDLGPSLRPQDTVGAQPSK